MQRWVRFLIRNVYRRTDGPIPQCTVTFAPAFDIGSFLKEAAQLRKPLVAAIGHSRPTTQAAVFDVDGTDVRDWTRKPRNVPGDLPNVGCYLIGAQRTHGCSIQCLSKLLGGRRLPEVDSREADGSLRSAREFINVNTPENLDAASRTLGESEGPS